MRIDAVAASWLEFTNNILTLPHLLFLYDVITNIEDETLQHPNSSSALSWP